MKQSDLILLALAGAAVFFVMRQAKASPTVKPPTVNTGRTPGNFSFTGTCRDSLGHPGLCQNTPGPSVTNWGVLGAPTVTGGTDYSGGGIFTQGLVP